MDYHSNVQKVMGFLKEKRVCSSSRASHEECYRTFAEYLSSYGLTHSADAGKQWLDSIRGTFSRQKCYFWNQYMKQFWEMYSTGTISDRNLYQNKSFYEKVPDCFRVMLDEYLDSCRHKYTKRSLEQATIYCSETMLFLSDRRLSSIEEITYQDIISLYNADMFCKDETKSILLGHAAGMLSFFAEKGLCKSGYSLLLDSRTYPYVGDLADFSQEHRNAIEGFRTRSQSNTADKFCSSIDRFVETLTAHGYVGSTLYLARHSLTALYLFLSVHELGYLPEIVWIWFAEIQEEIGSSWRHWRRVLKCYEEYFCIGSIMPDKKYRYEPGSLETLPAWCRESITAFLDRKRREFKSKETIRVSQYPCIRFCRYLISAYVGGVRHPESAKLDISDAQIRHPWAAILDTCDVKIGH